MNLSETLQSAVSGDDAARSALLQLLYDDLRRMAAVQMNDERPNHTLTATALVNEVSLKLLNDSQVPVQSRKQFISYAAKAMRNLLIDHARTKGRQKRGGNAQQFSFEEAWIACDVQRDDFLVLTETLDRLSEISPRKAQIVELKYFAGLNNQAIADTLDISLATVKRDWDVARTWLLHELQES